MLRNYIKFYFENLLKPILIKRKDVLKKTFSISHQNISKSQLLFPKMLGVEVCNVQSFRQKSKKPQKGKTETETDPSSTEEESFDETQDKHTKVLNINVTSLRVDAVLRSALGMARNKIDTLFYESKIRVNGEKIAKKSATVREGDEIDLYKGPDLKNSNFINIARVEILSMKADEDSILLKIRRCKSLTIEPY